MVTLSHHLPRTTCRPEIIHSGHVEGAQAEGREVLGTSMLVAPREGSSEAAVRAQVPLRLLECFAEMLAWVREILD